MSDIHVPKKCIVLSKKKLICLYPTEVQKDFGLEIMNIKMIKCGRKHNTYIITFVRLLIFVTYTDLRSITNQAAYGKPNEYLTFFLNSVIVDLNNSYKWNRWNQPQQKNITWRKRLLDKVVDNYVFLCTFMRANTAQKMAYSDSPTLLQSAFIAV